MATVKRRIELITLDQKEDSDSEFNKKIKNENIHSNKHSDYLLYADNSNEKKEINDFVKEYLVTLEGKIKKLNGSSVKTYRDIFINALEDIKIKHPEFLTQKHFKNLLQAYSKLIEDSSQLDAVVTLNTDIVIELKRIIRPANSNSSSNLNEKDLKKKVDKLTDCIKQAQDQLDIAEQMELSLDEMEKETTYTKLPKLRNFIVQCWNKRESLLNRSDFTGRQIFKKFIYSGTLNKKMDEIITKYFTNYLNKIKYSEDKVLGLHSKNKSSKKQDFSFPDIITLKNYLKNEIETAKLDFDLTDQILEKIYKDLLIEKKTRRAKEHIECLKSYDFKPELKPETMANENDPEFIQEITQNEEKNTSSLSDIISKYRALDYKRNPSLKEGNELGWDDKEGESSLDSEEDDEEEEDEEDDEEEGVDKEKDMEEEESNQEKNEKPVNSNKNIDEEIVTISDDE